MNCVVMLQSGDMLVFRGAPPSLRYMPNQHMLLMHGIKESEDYEYANVAAEIRPAIVLEGFTARGCAGSVRVIVLAVAALAAGAMPCFAAGLVIEAPILTATPGSTGSFDLLLTNTNPTGGTSYQVSSDQFMLSLSGPLGITFTGATIDTVATLYIFRDAVHDGDRDAALDRHLPEHPVHGDRLESRVRLIARWTQRYLRPR